MTLTGVPLEPPDDAASASVGSGGSSLDAEVVAASADPSRGLGRFVLLTEIGRGAMGVVHRAWDPSLRRLVAIKALQHAEPDSEAVLGFEREARAAARLRHPSIVSIYDVGEQRGAGLKLGS